MKFLREQRTSSSVGESQQDGDSVLLRAVSRLCVWVKFLPEQRVSSSVGESQQDGESVRASGSIEVVKSGRNSTRTTRRWEHPTTQRGLNKSDRFGNEGSAQERRAVRAQQYGGWVVLVGSIPTYSTTARQASRVKIRMGITINQIAQPCNRPSAHQEDRQPQRHRAVRGRGC